MSSGFKPFSSSNVPALIQTDEDYAVFFKPAQMHSVPPGRRAAGAGLPPEKAALDFLGWVRSVHADLFDLHECSDASKEMGMCSRLDFETSGLVVFARTSESFDRYRALQKQGRVRKWYTFRSGLGDGLEGSNPKLLNIRALDGQGIIESRFLSYGPRGARVACISIRTENEKFLRLADRKGRLAPGVYSTHIRRFGETETEVGASQIDEAGIFAGFRHQIRAHLAWIGRPILGDMLYGNTSSNRMFLESHCIEISDNSGNDLVYELYDHDLMRAE